MLSLQHPRTAGRHLLCVLHLCVRRHVLQSRYIAAQLKQLYLTADAWTAAKAGRFRGLPAANEWQCGYSDTPFLGRCSGAVKYVPSAGCVANFPWCSLWHHRTLVTAKCTDCILDVLWECAAHAICRTAPLVSNTTEESCPAERTYVTTSCLYLTMHPAGTLSALLTPPLLACPRWQLTCPSWCVRASLVPQHSCSQWH
jgi:hypothetical protein